MYKNAIIIASILIPLTVCQTYNNDAFKRQIYFPDDAMVMPKRPSANRFPAAAAAPLSSQYMSYEQFVNQLLSQGIGNLSLKINKAYQDQTDDNVVFATLNIAAALALVLLGSNGKTFQELTTVLGLATGLDIENRSVKVHEGLGKMIRKIETTAGVIIGQQVSFADAVFVQNNYPIRRLYKESAEALYNSEVVNVDFQSNPDKAAQLINAWVADRTKGKIMDIVDDVPSDTKVLIASAMYFKAEWENPFMEGVTTRRNFYIDGRKSKATIEVDMMANAGEFPYFKDPNLKAEILGLPYKGNATVMYVVMPFNSNKRVLKEFEAHITQKDLDYLADSTQTSHCQILFPKMKIESTIHLKPVLTKLGVTSLFDPKQANLGLLSPGMGPIIKNNAEINPLGSFQGNPNDVLIFSRTGETLNCSAIFDPAKNVSTCHDTVNNKTVAYKRFGEKVGRRIVKRDTVDMLRNLINQQSTDNNYQNPGLYAEDVIHKVYMDITETGTEAAAATFVTLYRTVRGVTFRVDVPFLFFIRHEETKTILFWGSIYKPTPNNVKV
ncbi:unnamed protein product [Phyllotreta striolata]|uniref:Serpin domain-containing protein n=1 Tax=Phyllotreta striolata TaxID=444603 RepID=A0A9N9TPI1_PHYSR|nr:unnamed protein product [Phyllotreta striolata]